MDRDADTGKKAMCTEREAEIGVMLLDPGGGGAWGCPGLGEFRKELSPDPPEGA